MSTESADAIDAAINSVESLFASLLDKVGSSTDKTLSDSGKLVIPASPVSPEASIVTLGTASLRPAQSPMSPEASIVTLGTASLRPAQSSVSPEASIVTLGTASLRPAQLMASSYALFADGTNPRESLCALVHRASLSSIPKSTSYDTLYKLLRDKENDLDLAAKLGCTLLKRNDLLESELGQFIDQRLQLEQQVAQLQHRITQKEELLRMYVSHATEQDEIKGMAKGEESKPEWVIVLTKECRELRESNLTLQLEADQLRKETADIETKERDLVQQCLKQFGEAKRTLSELRERSEESYLENQGLLTKLEDLSVLYKEEVARRQQLTDDEELLKEQLVLAHDSVSQLTHEVAELNEKGQENSILLKEANDEITALMDTPLRQPFSPSENGESMQGESIVREIEEVLRQEIAAASMLTERPRSPNHYARQRTMVVMETVRAATLATARRLERLAIEDKSHESTGHPFNPLAVSSPSNLHTNSGTTPTYPKATPPSPIHSDGGSPISLPDDLIRYRNQTYVAPQKLQIVKPLEGSMTLLKWKLLASPQLGGAKAYFSDASTPGVHLKKWPGSGVVDHSVTMDSLSSHSVITKQKSVSAMDLRDLNMTYPQPRSQRGRSSRSQETSLSVPGKSQPSPLASNNVQLPQERPDTHSKSLLSQFGSFLGAGLSKLRSKGETDESTPVHTDQVDTGLGGLL